MYSPCLKSEKKTKRILTSVSAVIIAFAYGVFVSCSPDLGEIKDENDYAEKFPRVEFVKYDPYEENDVKGIKDLYNAAAVNDFNDESFVCPTESNAYKYMAVFAGEDLSVSEFAVYLRSETKAVLDIDVYLASGLPTIIAVGDERDFTSDGSVSDPEGSPSDERKTLKVFDEPRREDAVAEVSVTLKANEWTSFSVKRWKVNGEQESNIRLKKSEEGGMAGNCCLLFQFRNNCVVYDEDEKPDVETPVKICFTAMLIRVE